MRKLLLTSVALSALLLAAPAYAQHHDRNGDSAPDATTPAPAATPAATPDTTATDNRTPLAGHHARDHAGTPATPPPHGPPPPPPPPPHTPAMIPGTPILAPGAGTHGTGHDNTGRDNSGTPGGNTGRGDNNTGRDNGRGGSHDNGAMGGSNPFGSRGDHAGRGHNSAFDALRRVFNAPHHYRHGSYHRPSGWYAHRWNYGEFLPSIFFTRNYWISDYSDFDLSDPPPGTVWVRYGNDALLIDEYNGEVIEVEYGIFY